MLQQPDLCGAGRPGLPAGGLVRAFDGKRWHSARLVAAGDDCARIRFLFRQPAQTIEAVLVPQLGCLVVRSATESAAGWTIDFAQRLPPPHMGTSGDGPHCLFFGACAA